MRLTSSRLLRHHTAIALSKIAMQADQSILEGEFHLPFLSPDLQIFPDVCERMPDAEKAFQMRRVHALHFTWGPKGHT